MATMMNGESYKCPKCQFDLGLDSKAAGQTLYCPQCSTRIMIPTLIAVELPDTKEAQQPVADAVTMQPTVVKKQSLAGRIIAGIVGGCILAIVGTNVISLLIGDIETEKQSSTVSTLSATALFMLWGIGIAIAVIAPRPGKAWRRLLIPSSLLVYAIPLAVFFTFAKASQNMATQSGQMGAGIMAIGGFAASACVSILSFFAGTILLIIGLLVGRDKRQK